MASHINKGATVPINNSRKGPVANVFPAITSTQTSSRNQAPGGPVTSLNSGQPPSTSISQEFTRILAPNNPVRYMPPFQPLPTHPPNSFRNAPSQLSAPMNPSGGPTINPGARQVLTRGFPTTLSVPGIPRQAVQRARQWNSPAQQDDNPLNQITETTSVWITHLPLACTYRDLLSAMPDTGKIYATVINPPRGHHTTTAAKIVFFDVEGKRRLLDRAQAGKFVVNNCVPSVRSNRFMTAPCPPGIKSRVLVISGPAAIVNRATLYALFQTSCVFDIEYVKDQPINGGVVMEWAFGSYRCQADRANAAVLRLRRAALEGSGPYIWRFIHVHYGRDPCDRE